MLSEKEIECIRACNECTTACLQCATSCINEADSNGMTSCIPLDLECADMCRLTAASIARGGDHMKAICALCAEVCQTCATECSKHDMEHCKKCAEASKRCAEACLAIAK
jgi:hypothetical protein